MQITIKVIPAARQNLFKEEGDIIKVYLTAPAVDGKANSALIKFLSKHYNVNVSRIEILKGNKAKIKVVSIDKNIA